MYIGIYLLIQLVQLMTSKGLEGIRTVNNINTIQEKQEDDSYISYDAPPLDFSFKNIKHISELKQLQPRQGQKMSVNNEESKIKSKKEKKEQEHGGQGEEDHKGERRKNQVIKLVPQSNLNTVVSTMVNSSAMKNISLKAKEELQKKKKKCIQIKLVCVSLMLGYNKIRELSGLHPVLSGMMQNPSSLQWIDISHNFLTILDYSFEDFPHLKTLYLHCNFISDLVQLQKLKHLQELKTMTVHGNPLSAVPNFRILSISILPDLKKLDSVLISKKERDNAVFIRSQTKKYPQPKNPPLPPQEKKEQDEQDKD